MMLVSSVSPSVESITNLPESEYKGKGSNLNNSGKRDAPFHPFISQAEISLPDHVITDDAPSNGKVSIKMLRDTGASQTLLREGTIPVSDKTFTGCNVPLGGIGDAMCSVPLHKVYFTSQLVSGLVTA